MYYILYIIYYILYIIYYILYIIYYILYIILYIYILYTERDVVEAPFLRCFGKSDILINLWNLVYFCYLLNGLPILIMFAQAATPITISY